MILRVLIAALAIWGMTWSKDANAIYMVRVCTYNPTTVCTPDAGCHVDAGEVCRYENWEGGGGGGYNPDPGDWGGGGGDPISPIGYTATGAIKVPDSDHNQEKEANCSSDGAVRLNHALQDVNAYVSKMTIFTRMTCPVIFGPVES